MAGVDRKVKHYRIHHDTGERTLNTDFNIFIILNGLAYIANLVLILTVGAFGGVSNTTRLLAYNFQSLVTVEEIFFQLAWGFIIPWQGFWAVWQIANPSERNCEGVVRAAYFYPLTVALYAGYTISCRMGMYVMGCIFCYGCCGTLVGLAMSLQKYRSKIWKGYLLWQGPLTLHAAWIMVETMLMTNLIFVRLNEDWIIKTVIGAVSVLVLFITAIAWLSSYPVDLLIPFVLMCAIGGIYLELGSASHYGNLIRQDYSNTMLGAWKWSVLAVFGLICLALIVKVIVVICYHRPKDQEDRRKKKESRVSVSITIDTGANNNNNSNGNNNNKKNRRNDRQFNNNRRAPPDEYADDYYGNNYDNEYGTRYDNEYDNNNDDYRSPPSTPKPKKKKSSSSKNKSRDGRDRSNSVGSPSPSPKKKKSSSSGGKKKKKSSSKGNRSPHNDTSATSIDDDDSMV